MTEGKITQWLKSEGDKVTKGEPILIVESDKAGEQGCGYGIFHEIF